LAWPAVVRVIANVFDKQIRLGADFPLDDKRRFGDRIALRLTRDPARPGGDAQTGCRGQHNTAGKRPKLRFNGGREVRKTSRAPTVNGVEIVG